MSEMVFFAIHADDVSRARDFYAGVFAWRFEPWGPPEFYLIQSGEGQGAVRGALQPRLEPLEGRGMRGYECSISVPDVDLTATLIERHGGAILMPRAAIPGVGWLVKFRDTEGNEAAIIQYSEAAE